MNETIDETIYLVNGTSDILKDVTVKVVGLESARIVSGALADVGYEAMLYPEWYVEDLNPAQCN